MMSRRFRRRITDVQDIMNAQFHRVLNNDTCEEEEPIQQRFQMFQQEASGGPIRQQRRGRTRRRMITFKVSLLRSSSVERLRSPRDATPSKRLVVSLDSESQEFLHTIKEMFPDMPECFELCKVNGQRWVTPLQVTCPREIQATHALGRSCLYIRPKPLQVTETGIETAANEASSGTLEAPGHVQEGPPMRAESEIASEMPQAGSSNEPSMSMRSETETNNEVLQAGTSHEQAASTREEFYLDSDSSDLEDNMMSSPLQNDPDDMAQLEDILSSFQAQNVDTTATITIIVRRRRILQSASVALSKAYFSWTKVPRVEFVSEMAEDYGGPQREFFRLLMLDVQDKLGVLEGRPGDLLFTYNQQALDQNKYYTAGKLTAWVITHNGPGLRCLNRQLYLLMCGQKPCYRNFDVDVFLNEEVSRNTEMLNSCRSEADLRKVQEDIGDWIASCGVPSVFSATPEDLTAISNQIVTHFLFHRVASMIHQFVAGMNSCGQFWDMVASNWKQFQPLFTATTSKLDREFMQQLLVVDWSPAGSNRREEEEATIFQWQWWLMEVQEGGADFSFEDLLVFVTGADSVPPLGFQKPCCIGFYDQEPGVRRLPYASTCSLTLFLPRGVEEEEEFHSLMDTALKGCIGFGKV